MHMNINIYIYMHMCIYMHINIHTYVYIYIHMGVTARYEFESHGSHPGVSCTSLPVITLSGSSRTTEGECFHLRQPFQSTTVPSPLRTHYLGTAALKEPLRAYHFGTCVAMN